jgi:hypothetical protein
MWFPAGELGHRGSGPGWWRRRRLGGGRHAWVLAARLGCMGSGRAAGVGVAIGRPSDQEVVVHPHLNLASLLSDPERSAPCCQIRAGGRMLHRSCGLIETERKLRPVLSCPMTATTMGVVVLLGGIVVVSIPPPRSHVKTLGPLDRVVAAPRCHWLLGDTTLGRGAPVEGERGFGRAVAQGEPRPGSDGSS